MAGPRPRGASGLRRRADDSRHERSGRYRALSLGHIEEAGRAHAATDAHGAHDVAGAATLALDQRMADHARAAHPVRMADRDGAAIDVELVHRDAQLVAAVDDLHGERLV